MTLAALNPGGNPNHVKDYRLSEKSIRANFQNLFHFKCDTMAKIIYVFLADG